LLSIQLHHSVCIAVQLAKLGHATALTTIDGTVNDVRQIHCGFCNWLNLNTPNA